MPILMPKQTVHALAEELERQLPVLQEESQRTFQARMEAISANDRAQTALREAISLYRSSLTLIDEWDYGMDRRVGTKDAPWAAWEGR